MVSYSDDEILEIIRHDLIDQKIIILAPVVRSRKGHYRELFEQTAKNGFLKVRVDGQLLEITPGMKVDRFKTHDIEIVIDQLIIKKDNLKRLEQSLKTAIEYGNGLVMLIDKDNGQQRFSANTLCAPILEFLTPNQNPIAFRLILPKEPVRNAMDWAWYQRFQLKK